MGAGEEVMGADEDVLGDFDIRGAAGPAGWPPVELEHAVAPSAAVTVTARQIINRRTESLPWVSCTLTASLR
jgi:hypothetical protein